MKRHSAPLFVLAIGLLLVGSSPVATASEAAPVALRGSHFVRVLLPGRSERGLALLANEHQWTLDVVGADLAEADFIDVTRGAGSTKWTLFVKGDQVALDDQRFVPGHAYRVHIHRGRQLLLYSLVYLIPPATRRTVIEFAEPEASPTHTASSDPIAIIPKGAL